ncbi:MAG: hypothetical protein M1830_003151 [Pleopsidium flavum]|nr:MAG: hypothetical protein M1830_003151 [Pleopsidium flavum]
MALGTTLPDLLSTLTESLSSTVHSVPEAAATLPTKDGISLFDTKNELLLSYLQNLVFLVIIKLRNITSRTSTNGTSTTDTEYSIGEVVKKLVELRVYLEKGVRPLEGRLKYQIDKILRAADDAARNAAKKPNGIVQAQKAADGTHASDDHQSDSEGGSSADIDTRPVKSAAEIDDLSYRPNPAALMRPGRPSDSRTSASKHNGIYRPPRITPTALPTTTGRVERAARKPSKSATLDEFISTELSSAPLAEPSIGSTIVSGGRRSKSQKERAADSERRVYEESNFVRLPKESKKERAKKGTGRRDGGYGGEEWRGLGEGVERIERLTQKKKGGGGVLERSRKRAVEDGPRSSGEVIGERFEKKRRMQGPRSRR